MRRIKILSRDITVGGYVIGRCQYGNDKPAKTTEDGDQLAQCGHFAFFGMKLVKGDRQRKSWLRLAHFCGNMVDELNKIKGLGNLADIASIQTNLNSRDIEDNKKKDG